MSAQPMRFGTNLALAYQSVFERKRYAFKMYTVLFFSASHHRKVVNVNATT